MAGVLIGHRLVQRKDHVKTEGEIAIYKPREVSEKNQELWVWKNFRAFSCLRSSISIHLPNNI